MYSMVKATSQNRIRPRQGGGQYRVSTGDDVSNGFATRGYLNQAADGSGFYQMHKDAGPSP